MENTESPRSSRWARWIDVAIVTVAMAMSIYHLIYSQHILQSATLLDNTHLGFALLIIFLFELRERKRLRPAILLLIPLTIVAIGYMWYFYDDLIMRQAIPTSSDLIIGVILISLVFIAVKFAYGWLLSIVVSAFVLYAALGQYLPPPLWHFPFSVPELISRFAMDFTGIYSVILSTSARYVFLFIIFGAMLQASGMVSFFEEVGKFTTSKFAGGAGLASTITSGMVGMITGIVSGNIALTGSFTIPMMKREGFRPERAGAIETVASTGGQIMPPVMGATAFIMAALLGVPYIYICGMAAMPAILYYLSCGMGIQVRALKDGLRPVGHQVDKRMMLFRLPIFVVPFFTMICLMLMDYTAMFAVFWAILGILVSYLVVCSFRPELRQPWSTWVRYIKEGALSACQVAVVMAQAGIMMACITMTGLGMKFPAIIGDLSGGNELIAYLLTAAAAIILGMGVATISAYLIVVFLVVPVLNELGVSLPVAHFFVLYYASLSFITPPIAPGAMVAAPIAGASYWKTAAEATKLSMGIFVIPFLIIWVPVLVLQPNDLIWSILGLIGALAFIIGIPIFVEGYFLKPLALAERVAIGLCLLLLLVGMGKTSHLLVSLGVVVLSISLWHARSRYVGGERLAKSE